MMMGRSDFDRSAFMVERGPLWGDFHFNMPTGEEWKASRSLLKDLMLPRYLKSKAAPFVYDAVLRLTNLWEAKMRAAEGRPFSMLDDLKGLSIDSVIGFMFGNDYHESVLARQVEHAKTFEPTKVKSSGHHQIVDFTEGPLHAFQKGLGILGDRVAYLYATEWPAQLLGWWSRSIFSAHRQLLREQDEFVGDKIDLAIRRMAEGSEANTAIDHMVHREHLALQKDGRDGFRKQKIIDEVYPFLSLQSIFHIF